MFMQPKVYIAGPYSSDPEGNTAKAIRVGKVLLSHGLVPFVPHFSHYFGIKPLDMHFWLENYDLPWLDSCDVLLRLPGYSPGADEEVKYADSHGIPVFHSIAVLIAQVKYFGVGRRNPRGNKLGMVKEEPETA